MRFDPTTLTLSPGSDYYLTVFFANNSNNSSIGATQPGTLQSSLSSVFLSGTDYTNMKAGRLFRVSLIVHPISFVRHEQLGHNYFAIVLSTERAPLSKELRNNAVLKVEQKILNNGDLNEHCL